MLLLLQVGHPDMSLRYKNVVVKSYEAEVRQKQVIPANWAMHVLEGRGYQRAAKEDY